MPSRRRSPSGPTGIAEPSGLFLQHPARPAFLDGGTVLVPPCEIGPELLREILFACRKEGDQLGVRIFGCVEVEARIADDVRIDALRLRLGDDGQELLAPIDV